MNKEFRKGVIVLLTGNKNERPNFVNTAIVTRVAKDGSWADVDSVFLKKRVKNPKKNLKIVDKPFVLDLI